MTAKTNTYGIITPAEVVQDFSANFLDEIVCRKYFNKKLHPSGPHCPHCHSNILDAITLNNFSALRRCQCKSCKRWFTALSGTFLQGSQLKLREIILLMLFMHYGIPHTEIARVLSVHPDTVKLWQRKIEALENKESRFKQW